MSDAYVVLNDAGAQCSEYWKMTPIWHENRFGSTARFMTRFEEAEGTRYHKKSVTKMYTGARTTESMEAAMPDATKIDTEDVYINVGTYDAEGSSQTSDMRRTAASCGYSIPASFQLKGDKNSVWNISKELARQVSRAMLEKKDQMIQCPVTGAKATIVLLYTSAGASGGATGPAAASSFVSITGSVSMFHKGELVDIRSAAATTYRMRCVVADVIYGDRLFGNNVGPGLVLTFSVDGDGSGTQTNMSTAATGDEIVASGEAGSITVGYPGSFPTLCDYGASPAAYFSVTRTTVGNHHWIPLGQNYTSGTALNLDTHFGRMFIELSRFIPPARDILEQQRVNMTKAIICQAQPDLILESCKQAGADNARFTRQLANTLPQAERDKLIAVTGWDGVLIRLPGFPPIAMVPEPLMTAGQVRLWDPNQWETIHLGPKHPTWLRDGGGIFHLAQQSASSGSDAKMVPKMIAGCFKLDTVFCNTPRTVYQMGGPLVDSI